MRFFISKSFKSVFAVDSTAIGKIQFGLTPKEFDFLEIEKDYLVCNEKLLRVKKFEKQVVSVSLDIASVEKISNEEKLKYCIGESNVGYAIFIKEKETSKEYFPPILLIRLFLSEDILLRVFNYNIKNNSENSVDIDFVNTSRGWEPDGSHLIWSSNDGELSIKSAQLEFIEMDKTERQLEDEEEKFWYERDDKKDLSKKFSIEESLTKIQYTMYLLVFLVLFYIFRNIH